MKKDSTFLHCRRVVSPHFIFNSFYLFSDQWSGALQREDVARMWDEPTCVWGDPEFGETLRRYILADVSYFRDPQDRFFLISYPDLFTRREIAVYITSTKLMSVRNVSITVNKESACPTCNSWNVIN